MNETYYIYYIVPDTNFVSEKETNQDSADSSGRFGAITEFVRNNLLIILLVVLLIIMLKQI